MSELVWIGVHSCSRWVGLMNLVMSATPRPHPTWFTRGEGNFRKMAEGPDPATKSKCEFSICSTLEICMKNVVRVFNVYTMNCAYFSTIDYSSATPTLKELWDALDSIVDWYSLGVKLGLEDHQLRMIRRDYHGDNERCKYEILSHWLQSAKLPTWKPAADALILGIISTHLDSRSQAKHCHYSIFHSHHPQRR